MSLTCTFCSLFGSFVSAKKYMFKCVAQIGNTVQECDATEVDHHSTAHSHNSFFLLTRLFTILPHRSFIKNRVFLRKSRHVLILRPLIESKMHSIRPVRAFNDAFITLPHHDLLELPHEVFHLQQLLPLAR